MSIKRPLPGHGKYSCVKGWKKLTFITVCDAMCFRPYQIPPKTGFGTIVRLLYCPSIILSICSKLSPLSTRSSTRMPRCNIKPCLWVRKNGVSTQCLNPSKTRGWQAETSCSQKLSLGLILLTTHCTTHQFEKERLN